MMMLMLILQLFLGCCCKNTSSSFLPYFFANGLLLVSLWSIFSRSRAPQKHFFFPSLATWLPPFFQYGKSSPPSDELCSCSTWKPELDRGFLHCLVPPPLSKNRSSYNMKKEFMWWSERKKNGKFSSKKLSFHHLKMEKKFPFIDFSSKVMKISHDYFWVFLAWKKWCFYEDGWFFIC